MTATGWWLWLMLGAVAEIWALATHGVTLSSVIIGIRNDPFGRWVFWILSIDHAAFGVAFGGHGVPRRPSCRLPASCTSDSTRTQS